MKFAGGWDVVDARPPGEDTGDHCRHRGHYRVRHDRGTGHLELDADTATAASASGSVVAAFIDGDGHMAQSRTLVPGDVAHRYVRVANDGAVAEQVVAR